MDAGQAQLMESLGVDAKRLCRWLLPAEAVSDADLARMRPDILRIIGLPPTPTRAQIAHALANKSQYSVQVVEVGYCSDYNWRRKVADKKEQHATATLIDALLCNACCAATGCRCLPACLPARSPAVYYGMAQVGESMNSRLRRVQAKPVRGWHLQRSPSGPVPLLSQLPS